MIVFENYFNCDFIFPWVSTMISRRDKVGLGNRLGDDQFFQRLNYTKLPSLVSCFCKEMLCTLWQMLQERHEIEFTQSKGTPWDQRLPLF